MTIVSLAAPVCPNAPLKQSLRAIFIRLMQTLAPSAAHALVYVPARLSACPKEHFKITEETNKQGLDGHRLAHLGANSPWPSIS